MGLFGNDTKEDTFWKWFTANQEDIYHFEKDREAVFDRLSSALHKVHEELTFEFSPVREDGTREFVISAGGMREVFPVVESLAAKAPELKKWTIIKYRQRRFPLSNLKYGDKDIKSKDVHYAIFKDNDPKKVGIIVFLNGYTEAEKSTWGQIGFLFLDEALGEYDVATHVGHIVFLGRDSEYFKHANPISELPEYFDEYLGRTSK